MRTKKKTIKEEFIEKTVNLTLTGLEAKERLIASREAANDDIFTKINIAIAAATVQIKDFFDSFLGDNKDKFHDFVANFLLGK